MRERDTDRTARDRPESEGRKRAAEEETEFGIGATGGHGAEESEEEREEHRGVHATPEGAARQDDDPEALREGRARANVREEIGEREGGREPARERDEREEDERETREPSNRRGMHPGGEGTRRGRKERSR